MEVIRQEGPKLMEELPYGQIAALTVSGIAAVISGLVTIVYRQEKDRTDRLEESQNNLWDKHNSLAVDVVRKSDLDKMETRLMNAIGRHR
jgi:hypothetical protein